MSSTASTEAGKWTERPIGGDLVRAEEAFMFAHLFERTADAVWLLDPATRRFVDCNQSAVNLMRAGTKDDLLQRRPEDLSPELQEDGAASREKAIQVLQMAQQRGSYRFEWTARRLDGEQVPLEVTTTLIPRDERSVYVVVCRDITERKKAEAEIRRLNLSLERRIAERTAELTASEARLRTLVEHAPEAIVVFDGETGRFLSGNADVCRIYGHTAEELTRLSPSDVSPEYQPNGQRSEDLAREKMQEALAGGAPVFEWLHRHSSGRLIPTEVRLVRLPSEGKPLLRASIIDNTDRKRREKVQQALYRISEATLAARTLESLYRDIHEIVKGLMPAENFYIALLDTTTHLISFPYHVDERTPRPAPLPPGAGLTSYVLRYGKPLLVDAAMQARKRKVGEMVTFDGFADIQYVERGAPAAIWLGVPLLTGDKPIGVMAVQDYHDPAAYGEEEKQLLGFVAGQIATAIERTRVEQALRDSEAKYRALFAASSQGVMLHDEKQYLEVNPAAVRILGYPSEAELLGRNPGDTSPPFQPTGQRSGVLSAAHIAHCMEHGSARFDWVARSSRGEDIQLEVILTRIEWSGRRVIQAVINDISNRKKAEAELLRALAREKELGQLKSSFVSMVSHEFRTPLGIILSSAEILDHYFEQLEAPERREHLRSIQKNTRRMANLMEEVLLLAKVEAGKMDFKPAALDLRRFCARAIEEVRSTVPQECRVTLVASGDLPEAFADERLLNHIFTNLLSNAVKYSPAGSPVEFHLEREGKDALLRIRDQGMGIPESDRQYVFQAFHRGQNVGDVPGTGLGLVIVRRCVELHRGQIHLDSTVGKGTTVTVRLPLFPS